MLVCPKCGSIHVSEIGYSGFSGVSGYSGSQGFSGISGFSGPGPTGPVGTQMPAKNDLLAFGVPTIKLSNKNPNVNVNAMPQTSQSQSPPYEKQFRCSDCNWTGKERELIDDFKFAIMHAAGQTLGGDPMAGSSVRSEQGTHNPLVEGSNPSQPIVKKKSILELVTDKLLGEKRKQ